MELAVKYQSWQFLWALLLGIALGWEYDFLWGLRRTVAFVTWLWDLLVGFSLLLGNWLLFLYVGDGEYRLFFLPTTILGFFLWRKTLGKAMRVCSRWFWQTAVLPVTIFWRNFKKIIEKMKFFLKNLFSNRKKSVKIKEQHSIGGGENGG